MKGKRDGEDKNENLYKKTETQKSPKNKKIK